MIKKEIGCTDMASGLDKVPDSHVIFVPCRICLMNQGDLDCIHFRHEVNAKMIYGEYKCTH